MRVKIDRDVCPASLSFCERCLGKFLKEPLGYERRCFVELEETPGDNLYIDLHTDGRNVHLELTPEERAQVSEWTELMDFEVGMYRNKKNEDD
jgi:hypothetical protein